LYPTTFLIDRQGRLVDQFPPNVPASMKRLEELLNQK
jgi:hypothetical protein